MKFYIAALFSISLMVFSVSSCIDPTEIGSELLDEDLIDVGFTDTFSIISTTIKGDSVRTHKYLTFLDGYLLGDFEDPFFGRSTASFYGQVGMLRTGSGVSYFRPKFDESVIDSTVLVFGLDSSLMYGNNPLDVPFTVKISQLAEVIDPVEDQYSNATFLIDPDGIGSPGETTVDIFPRIDTLEVFDYSSGSVDTIKFPHIRIPLPDAFGQRFLDADSLDYVNDSTFVDFFNGFAFEPVSENDGLLSLDLRTSGSDAVAGLYVYYSAATMEGDSGQYRFPFNAYKSRVSTFVNDHSGYPVEDYIDNPDRDSLTFMQGMEGLFTKIEIPYISENKDLIVNKAELVLTLAELPGFDYDVYDPVGRIILSKLDEDGSLQIIADVSQASDLDSAYGGTLVKGVDGEPDKYKINISAHLQDMIEGVEPPVLYLTTHQRALNMGQSAIYGGSHDKYPIKLNLHFTKQ